MQADKCDLPLTTRKVKAGRQVMTQKCQSILVTLNRFFFAPMEEKVSAGLWQSAGQPTDVTVLTLVSTH